MQFATTYSAKYKPGYGRIYMTQKKLFSLAGLLDIPTFSVTYGDGFIDIRPSLMGESNLFKTARGLLLELKNKSTANSVNFANKVLAIATKGMLKIIPHPAEVLKHRRESRFIKKTIKGLALDSGSLYTGLGLLNLHLATGLNTGGIKTNIVLANDICHAAMTVNTETNPIWASASKKALVVNDDIRSLQHFKLPQVDILDVSYPCNGISNLISKDQRDIDHKVVGTLFMPTIEVVKKVNPTIIVIECTPAFNNSKTLELMERELSGYVWHKTTINGLDYGEIEKRSRACVIAISDGLVDSIDLSEYKPMSHGFSASQLRDFMEPQKVTDNAWKTYDHVKAKVSDPRLCFKHRASQPSDMVIPTITATYSAPKIGAAFIAHQSDQNLMRQVLTSEHANIRRIPAIMKEYIEKIASGDTLLTSSRGSVTLAHKLLGMSVSKRPWEAVGKMLAQIINDIVFQWQFSPLNDQTYSKAI